MTLLEDFADFTLWHDAPCASLYATWRGKHSSGLTRAQYGLIRRHVQQTGSTKLLHDSLQDEDGWHQLTRWLGEEYFRLLAQDGVQIIAWVLPRQLEAFYDTAQLLACLQQPAVDTFIDAQAAYDWLHRWPLGTPAAATNASALTPAAFLLLPPGQQLDFVRQQGRPLVPRWESDYYVRPYQVLEVLQVEAYYHLHSGEFYQLRAQLPS